MPSQEAMKGGGIAQPDVRLSGRDVIHRDVPGFPPHETWVELLIRGLMDLQEPDATDPLRRKSRQWPGPFFDALGSWGSFVSAPQGKAIKEESQELAMMERLSFTSAYRLGEQAKGGTSLAVRDGAHPSDR